RRVAGGDHRRLDQPARRPDAGDNDGDTLDERSGDDRPDDHSAHDDHHAHDDQHADDHDYPHDHDRPDDDRAHDDHHADDDRRHDDGHVPDDHGGDDRDDDGHDHDDRAVKVLYFGTYDREHPRNVNAIAALRAAGVEVAERRAEVRHGGARGMLSVLRAETRLLAPVRRDFDAVIVGYPGHFDVPRARRIAGRVPLVFDAVLSLEDELVAVRRRFRPRSTAATVLRAVDSRALRLPDA